MPNAVTPMMQQYQELKKQYPDCFLFYRLGDFYEMFFDDAIEGSKLLELTLTGRGCGLQERAPMCGVPYHSVDTYINKLIEKGYKIAICEQMEDPAQAKGLVDRAVIRVITPGTVIEEKMLDSGKNHYILALLISEHTVGYAYCDVSTGAFRICQYTGDDAQTVLLNEMERIAPTEVVVPDSVLADPFLSKRVRSAYYVDKLPQTYFQTTNASQRLMKHFGVSSLAGYGCESMSIAVGAAGALMRYLEDTQKNALSHIHTIKIDRFDAAMQLDAATRRNLELTQPLWNGNGKRNTILALLNHTETAMGSRMLRCWIDCPLQSIDAIVARQDAVDQLYERTQMRKRMQEHLSQVYDIERLSSKIAYGTVQPRDCLALASSLKQILPIRMLLSDLNGCALTAITSALDLMEDVIALIDASISPDAPSLMKDGGYIKNGYHQQVDEYRNIAQSSKEWLDQILSREREQTGIKNLRIGFNHVFGYYLEVTKSFAAQVPYYYERKQTLANAERFITPELKEVESKILYASGSLLVLEAQLFAEIRNKLTLVTERLQNNSALLAELDCYQSLAEVARTNRYVRPKITDDGVISILGGRHPVVERNLQSFIANDVLLDGRDHRLLIITGPNMAGKSTYMRQVALITLMAHIGSFVSADQASICLVDRIFTRIGASDDLASGQSTFMVEMSEVANILNNATEKSLLILDEIGRGTSTFDGLSIAWAVLEHLASPNLCGAKTLFATHYHELSELEGRIDGVKNYRISVKEIGDTILFLRKIERGSADKSFGIQVAKLAGIPEGVIKRAKDILCQLEQSDLATNTDGSVRPDQRKDTPPAGMDITDEVADAICSTDLGDISPISALNMLYQWQQLLKERQ